MSDVVVFPSGQPLRGNIRTVDTAKGFYTLQDASRLSRIPESVVRKWRPIVKPSLALSTFGGKETFGYTFDSLVLLRLIRRLRESSISLPRSVNAVHLFVDMFGAPGPNWANGRFFRTGSELLVRDIRSKDVVEAARRQYATRGVLFDADFSQFKDRLDVLLVPERFARRVEIDPEIMDGHPVVKGTAIETSVVAALRDKGMTESEIVEYYPHLTHLDIRASRSYERFLASQAA